MSEIIKLVERMGGIYYVYFVDGSMMEVGSDGVRVYPMTRKFQVSNQLAATISCKSINEHWHMIVSYMYNKAI